MCFCKDWGLSVASDLFINLPNYISADGRKNQHATSPVPRTHIQLSMPERPWQLHQLSHHIHCPATEPSDSSHPQAQREAPSLTKGIKESRKTEVGIDYKRSMSQCWVSVCNVMNLRGGRCAECKATPDTQQKCFFITRCQVTELASLRSFFTSSKKKINSLHEEIHHILQRRYPHLFG